MGGQGREVKPEGRRQHGAVALDGRDTEASGRPQPVKKIGNLRKGWMRNRMTMRMAPGTVNHPLELVVGTRRWTARQGSLRSYFRRETRRSGEAPESLQA